MVTKSEIIALLRTNDRAIARALMVLADRQTADEQASESTRYDNGRGFRPCHARMGTSMAKFFRARGYLSPKQVAYWRAAMKSGQMRIEIYAGQLMDAAKVKADAKAQATQVATKSGGKYGVYQPATNMVKVNGEWEQPANPYIGCDVGNMMEERMVLAEMNPNDPRLAAIDEAAMMAMDAVADRRQTELDEQRKFLAKLKMEG
jgi:hypothetical protein